MKLRNCLLLVLIASFPSFGDTIYEQLFNNTGSTGRSNALFAVSWAQTGTFTNVSIFANINDGPGNGTATGTAYLMNQIGAGTTAANEVVSPVTASVNGNPGLNAMTTIFSNLTLGPGTYFLVINPTDTLLDWDETSSVGVTEDPGVTGGASETAGTVAGFAPASAFTTNAFSLIYEVTGTPSAQSTAPEPTSIATLFLGLGALAFTRKRLKLQLHR